jgi:hypothetical protein
MMILKIEQAGCVQLEEVTRCDAGRSQGRAARLVGQRTG